MNQKKRTRGASLLPAVLLAVLVAFAVLAGCGCQNNEQPTAGTASEPASSPAAEQSDESYKNEEFSFSKGIDENGFWEGIKALELIEMFDYKGIKIPKDAHEVPADAIQSEIDSILESYSDSVPVMDRAVVDGDTVNIDYIGSIDGVEFENGNTNGMGAEVTIGVTNFIDDFLQQLIGHSPGDTFNVEVTFPADYGVETLNGKDAVFVTTVNYIVKYVKQELTDSFVEEKFSERFGWKSVQEFRDGIREDMRKSKSKEFIANYMNTEVKVKSIPDSIMTYQEGAMIEYYKNMADSYGLELEEFLVLIEVPDLDALFEANREGNEQWARYSLASQAIAEDLAIIVSTQDVTDHFKNIYGMDDYSNEVEIYGLPYLKQMVMYQHVMDHLIDHAVLEA